MPIRQNKKWGKEMRMSACLTQPNGFAGHVDSQRNLITCGLTKAGSGGIIICEPRGRRVRRDCQPIVGE